MEEISVLIAQAQAGDNGARGSTDREKPGTGSSYRETILRQRIRYGGFISDRDNRAHKGH